MAELTTTLTEYSGVAPNRLLQTQAQFDAAATTLMDYWVVLAPELNAIASEQNGLRSELLAVESASESARDLAETYRDQAETYRDGAALYQSGAQTAATTAQAAQAAAESAETAAEGYASLAQATNPDTPIRVNPNAISEDFTLASGYNGVSAGPIDISTDAIVTITHQSAWSIT